MLRREFHHHASAGALGAWLLALAGRARAAAASLGRPDGFLGNPWVRIDELVTSINRAAEAAVPLGKDLLVQWRGTPPVRWGGPCTGALAFAAPVSRNATDR